MTVAPNRPPQPPTARPMFQPEYTEITRRPRAPRATRRRRGGAACAGRSRYRPLAVGDAAASARGPRARSGCRIVEGAGRGRCGCSRGGETTPRVPPPLQCRAPCHQAPMLGQLTAPWERTARGRCGIRRRSGRATIAARDRGARRSLRRAMTDGLRAIATHRAAAPAWLRVRPTAVHRRRRRRGHRHDHARAGPRLCPARGLRRKPGSTPRCCRPLPTPCSAARACRRRPVAVISLAAAALTDRDWAHDVAWSIAAASLPCYRGRSCPRSACCAWAGSPTCSATRRTQVSCRRAPADRDRAASPLGRCPARRCPLCSVRSEQESGRCTDRPSSAPAVCLHQLARSGLPRLLARSALPQAARDVVARCAPVVAVAVSIALVRELSLQDAGVFVVGAIPTDSRR